MIKLFLGFMVFVYGWIWLEQYRNTELLESGTSLSQRYAKSSVKSLLPKDRFEFVAGRMPKVASLLLAMDPGASGNALKRWFLLVIIGWMHFCFLSRWPAVLMGNVPGTQVFWSPFGMIFFFLGLKLIQAVMGYFSPLAEKYFGFLLQAGFWFVLLCMISISLLSIPASLALLMLSLGKTTARILMIAGCRLWTLGEKMLGAPQSGIQLKISECISQKLSHLTGDGYRRGPALPGPIVRRMEINGVKYDF